MISRNLFSLKNGFSEKFKIISNIKRYQLPEKWKRGRIEKISVFWQALFADYKIVAGDVIQESKTKPRKAAAIVSALGVMLTAIQLNPDSQSFYDQYINCCSHLIIVADPIQNPIAADHMQYLSNCVNQGILRRTNLIFCSLLWVADYDKNCNLYSAQCNYLKPRYLTFYERIVDFGVFSTWINLKIKMKDFDVNPNEWILEK